MPEQETVLIVDDNPEILRAATLRLESAGYDTLAAVDGQDAVEIAEDRHPDGVLMDVDMPVMDGITALKELKDIDSTEDIPVIIMSADESNRQSAHDAGAEAFVRKPYQGAEMVQVVTEVIRPA